MANENNEIKYYQKSQFVANCKLTVDDPSKLLFKRDGKASETLYLHVTDDKSVQTLEVFTYGVRDQIYAKIDGKFTEIDWAERNNEAHIKKVHFSDKYQTNFGESKEFISVYDFIHEILKAVESGKITKDTVLRVRGDIEYSLYNGKQQSKLIPKGISIASEKEQTQGLYFRSLVTTLFKKDSLVKDEENKKFILNGFIQEWIKLEGETSRNPRLFDQSFIIDYGKNEKMADAIKAMYLQYLDVQDDKVHAICFESDLYKGASEVKVEPLTDEQKMFISIGILTEEEAIEYNTTRGEDKVIEHNVVRPMIKVDPYKKVTFVPSEQDKFVFGFEPKVETFFAEEQSSTSDELSGDTVSVFGDSDLANFFN